MSYYAVPDRSQGSLPGRPDRQETVAVHAATSSCGSPGPEERDEVTGLIVAEMEAVAEDLYAHRDEAVGDEVPSEFVGEIRSVVSARFGSAGGADA